MFKKIGLYNMYIVYCIRQWFLTFCRSRTPDEHFLDSVDPLTILISFFTSHVNITKIIINIYNYILSRHFKAAMDPRH